VENRLGAHRLPPLYDFLRLSIWPRLGRLAATCAARAARKYGWRVRKDAGRGRPGDGGSRPFGREIPIRPPNGRAMAREKEKPAKGSAKGPRSSIAPDRGRLGRRTTGRNWPGRDDPDAEGGPDTPRDGLRKVLKPSRAGATAPGKTFLDLRLRQRRHGRAGSQR